MAAKRSVPWTQARASVVVPPGPETGFVNARCYAAPLADCSEDISREHYFSRSVLEAMEGGPSISGLRFQEPGTKLSVGVEALTAKVLCSRHNAALSALDNAAGHFFHAVRAVDRGLRDAETSPSTETVVVNGADLERWTLKVLAGAVHGKVVSTTALRSDFPWLRVLFGLNWPTGSGLSVVAPTAAAHAFGGLGVQLATVRSEVWAADFDISNVSLRLTLGRPKSDPRLFPRPAGLIFRRADLPGATKTITFAWPRRPRWDYVEFIRVGEYDGDRPQDRHLVDRTS